MKPMTPELSVAVVTYNEGHLLRDCLESVRWADEIVIVDLGSADDTLAIAKEYATRIVAHAHAPIADMVRNFSFENTSGRWILLIDPDERVPHALATEIQEIVAGDEVHVAAELPLTTHFFGRQIKYAGYGVDYLARLFRRGAVTWRPEVHFRPSFEAGQVIRVPYNPKKGNAILHLNYVSVAQFVEKMNRYSDSEARRLWSSGYRFRWYKPISYAAQQFLDRFVHLSGFRDRQLGFIVSMLFAIYWATVALKLWELDHAQTALGAATGRLGGTPGQTSPDCKA
jgi:glycosyltransferase involved in cell wall biosynthesis